MSAPDPWAAAYAAATRHLIEREAARDRADHACRWIVLLPRAWRVRSRRVRLWRACCYRLHGARVRWHELRTYLGGGA